MHLHFKNLDQVLQLLENQALITKLLLQAKLSFPIFFVFPKQLWIVNKYSHAA